MIDVSKMEASDAASASQMLRSSIVELCIDDHRNDPSLISHWLANKTPNDIAAWIAGSQAELFVAKIKGSPAGVGGLLKSGTITLNYVAPAWRFKGVSQGLLFHMEARLSTLGVNEAKLTSTKTAHSFYKRAGWSDAGMPTSTNYIPEFPMKKILRNSEVLP